jgi:hypothetical protein
MITLLATLSILIAAIAAFTPLLPALIPRIGLLPIYRMRLLRALFLLTTWALAIAAAVGSPPSFFALPFVLLLSIPTIILEPQRLFVPLDDPEHVSAAPAEIQGEALVLGYADDEYAVAWPFETLAPRHLINDQVGETPLLAAY